jgi:hypothetical protein
MTDDKHAAAPIPGDTAPPAWQEGLDAELGAFVARKGWRAPADIVTSYRNLEKMMGAERLILPAADAGHEAWSPIWDRLGRPPRAEDYDLPQAGAGQHDAELSAWYRTTAHRLGLTQAQARDLHDAFLARLQPGAESPPLSGDNTTAEPLPDPAAELRDTWGRHYDANMLAARRAYAAFLGDTAPFHDIADALGETALMELLAKAGRHLAEDSITARAAGGADPRNPAEALAEIAKLRRQVEADGRHPYLDKTHPEHQSLVQRMEALYALAYGGS